MSQSPSKLELREIDRAALMVGNPLPGSVRDRNGRVLLAKGSVLTAELVTPLMRMLGYGRVFWVGPDWPAQEDDATALSDDDDAIMQALTDSCKKVDDDERRQHPRHQFSCTINLAVEEQAGLSLIRRTVNVEAVDISLSGLGFNYRQFLRPGSRVYCEFDMITPARVREGVVRYCWKMEKMNHRVGVEFVSANDQATKVTAGISRS